MHSSQPNVFVDRDDTFFGVCEALGEDFGFNPNFLRVALALTLFWNPAAALGAYAGLGLIVGITRCLVPNSASPRIEVRGTADEPATGVQPAAEHAAGDHEAGAEALAAAA